MKRINTFICIMFVAIGWSQEQSLEVIITKDVTVKAESFIYMIDADGSMNNLLMGLSYDEEEAEEPLLDADLVVSEFLKKEKFTYIKGRDLDFEISDGSNGGLFVTVESVERLKKLTAFLEGLSKVSGMVKKANYESISPYYPKVYGEMANTAKEQARALAKSGGRDLGELISIKELPESSNASDAFGDAYQQLMKKALMSMADYNNVLEKTVTIKMVYRFSLK